MFDFSRIIKCLEEKPLAVNKDRKASGVGETQAFGIIRRWAMPPGLSRNTYKYPELWAALLDFADKHVMIPWHGIQVNHNYQSEPHRDAGNCGDSYIVSFGEYTGGELCLGPSGEEIDTRGGFVFNGSQTLHWNKPIVGNKYSLVFFSITIPSAFAGMVLPTYRSIYMRDRSEWAVVEIVGGNCRIYNKNGDAIAAVTETDPEPTDGHRLRPKIMTGSLPQKEPSVSEVCEICGGTYIVQNKKRHVLFKKHQEAVMSLVNA